MVTRNRLRTVLRHVGLWSLAAGSVVYFGYHAVHGHRGLEARRGFEAEIASLKAQLSGLELERKSLEDRAGQLEPASVDRDLLDEQARMTLGWLHPNDRIVAQR